MPLFGEGEYGQCRYGLSGGCLPPDWFQIAYDSDETDILSFAELSTQDVYAGSSPGGKIYKYDGSTWTLAYDSPETRINDLVNFGDELYAATGPNGLVYKSSDGSTWSLAYDSPLTDINTFLVFNNNLYAGGSNGIIYKTADGSTWSLAYDSPADEVHDLAQFGGDMYAATGDTNGIIYKSGDGSTWSLAYDGSTTHASITALGAMGSNWPSGVATLLAGNGSSLIILGSTDGTTWTVAYDGPGTVAGVKVIYATDAMTYVGVGNSGVLYRSDNTSDWSVSYDASDAARINALHGVSITLTGYGSNGYGSNGYGGASTCGDLLIGTGSNAVVYSMDNLVSADLIPDIVQPDGGETITTDTYTIIWSMEATDYSNIVWNIQYTTNYSTNRDWIDAVDDTGGDPGHTGASLIGISTADKVTQDGNYLQATWNVLPIIDSSDMAIRVQARDTSSSACATGSWNEPDAIFGLQNGPC